MPDRPSVALVIAPVIALADPRDAAVRPLLAALDAYLGTLYPPESNHILDIERLAQPDIRFFVASLAGVALGCAALRLHAEYGEVKRLYVDPAARGLGLGRQLLARLEATACELGLPLLRLETGIHQPEAIGLFRAAGFVERGPFGAYGPDPLSLFMQKPTAARLVAGGNQE
jgi:putative acetyltransferase